MFQANDDGISIDGLNGDVIFVVNDDKPLVRERGSGDDGAMAVGNDRELID